jgi:endonuclease V-like protein UPF0215 family
MLMLLFRLKNYFVMLHTFKKGIRALGIAESFTRNISSKSVLAGVVMRGDFLVDGFSFSYVTIGGLDATDAILNLYKKLKRRDISVLFINGCIISWYNVIDLNRIYSEIKIPLVSLTYKESLGLDENFRNIFPQDYDKRIEIYRRNGDRERIKLNTGYDVFVRYLGMGKLTCRQILNRFTISGKIPEPIKAARILAKSINIFLTNEAYYKNL